jgi:hypothetical protein
MPTHIVKRLASIGLSDQAITKVAESLIHNLESLVGFSDHPKSLKGHRVIEFLLQLGESVLKSLNCVRSVAGQRLANEAAYINFRSDVSLQTRCKTHPKSHAVRMTQ